MQDQGTGIIDWAELYQLTCAHRGFKKPKIIAVMNEEDEKWIHDEMSRVEFEDEDVLKVSIISLKEHNDAMLSKLRGEEIELANEEAIIEVLDEIEDLCDQ